ncbi:MAG TPA: alpha/beta fold hydrolase [Opitutaceae bacterium]|nr:alpha/beta fold hydrolase [Opitutaceae bacterium]
MRLSAFFLGLMAVVAPASAQSAEPECVVLLHGAGARGVVMKRVEARLRRAGYRTVNITYPSRRAPFEQLARDYLPERLRRGGVARAPRVHFVTHSMGGLVLRLHLQEARPDNLGRVVMIGPPNHGTIAADSARRNRFLHWFFGANLRHMGTGDDALHHRLGPADYDLGVIAGSGVINPIYTRKFGGPNDGIVAVESTKLAGMRDFIVLPYSHTMILFRRETGRQVLAYLQGGRFAPAAAAK